MCSRVSCFVPEFSFIESDCLLVDMVHNLIDGGHAVIIPFPARLEDVALVFATTAILRQEEASFQQLFGRDNVEAMTHARAKAEMAAQTWEKVCKGEFIPQTANSPLTDLVRPQQ
jgi:hypothetical protein